MIDAPGREHARFPASAEERVRTAIRAAIQSIKWNIPGPTVGIAGAASGGDLLFHEICAELGIPTRILLGLPAGRFEAESVAPAGDEWVRRFHALLARNSDLLIMGDLDGRLEYPAVNVWHRANLWMIEMSSTLAGEQALLALWDGQTGDGPGGTQHFLEVARRFKVRVLEPIRIDVLLAS